MKTPVCDFARAYAESGALRLHMPGHKGVNYPLDITEIDGADNLFDPKGILRESEQNAEKLFGCPTFYSAEGSSLCIRAMLYLCSLYAKEKGQKPRIAAGRNAHKVFLFAAALLDIDVSWIYPVGESSYLSCPLSAKELDDFLSACEETPTAVYLTSPDYLGNLLDIAAIAKVCKKRGVLLLVDNAHGAYLKFLPASRHPIDLGADACCDSAHKTLPALTGAAYLHVSKNAPNVFTAEARTALSLFASTSPSYLILESLDALNPYLAQYPEKLAAFAKKAEALKEDLKEKGFALLGDEPLKITLSPKAYGYTGDELAKRLAAQNIVAEFSDPDALVLMLTPETGDEGLSRLRAALAAIERKEAIATAPPTPCRAPKALSPKEAILSPSEEVSVKSAVGRVLAAPTVSCPPAIPIAVSGETITGDTLAAFDYYGVTTLRVVKNIG